MDLLRLRFEPEDQWHGKVTADVSAKGFAGRGSGWFATAELRNFVAAMSAFPLDAENLPSITGGFGATQEALEQVHVAIAFAPHDVRGSIRATVRLATEVWNADTADLASSVLVRFLVTYADLDKFGAAISGLLDGEIAEATLQSWNA
ncbi:hypothetical protein SAMN06297144_0688 [Sphingomonas guangdongensis]|uniref:Uncharacterized protein n=1 Tax=Sphingomonas guangdongensis TaxID=1141890 RepID=A0A285QI16_9SPHN|nr:hypothetical protein [Sphingomonas guangdongensis]SOB79702.1 hypothetical protein SAMN06297144_0688 [Sphingomonas guangdongensis]